MKKLSSFFLLVFISGILLACGKNSSSSSLDTPPLTETEKKPEKDFDSQNQSKESKRDSIIMLQLNLGGKEVFNLLKSEAERPMTFRSKKTPVQEVSLPNPEVQNPFAIEKGNFLIHKKYIEEKDADWFQQQIEENRIPDILYIGGHHVPSQGWHTHQLDDQDHSYQSIYFPTLLNSLKKYPAMKIYFSKIKFVFIGGCWGLANLEPHGKKGEYLSPDKIKQLYFSSAAGKSLVLGNKKNPHSLEYQKWELTQVYSADYTQNPNEKACDANTCSKWYIHEALPDIGLFDGSRRYNIPYLMRYIFPNAQLVVGFHSPSPFNQKVAQIYRNVFASVRAEFPELNNIFVQLLNPENSEVTKKMTQSFRKNWTLKTYQLNNKRASGSITPAYPDLDQSGLFVLPESMQLPWAPRFSPYYELNAQKELL
jgi:hypothetical protein